MTHAARLAVVVHELVAARQAFEKVLVTDASLTCQDFGRFQGILRGIPIVIRFSLARFSILGHAWSPNGPDSRSWSLVILFRQVIPPDQHLPLPSRVVAQICRHGGRAGAGWKRCR